MRRRAFLCQSIGLAVASCVPATGVAGACGLEIPTFVQVTAATQSVQRQIYGSFRIMADDTIHFARWNGQKRLLELGVARRDPALPFDTVRRVVARNFGLFDSLFDFGRVAGRFSDWVKVAHSDGIRTRSKVLRKEVPDAIQDLVADLERGNATRAPEAGRSHVWTNPVQSAGPRDLKIDDACDDPVARAVIRSLDSGAVAVPVEGDGGRFVRGENAHRFVFIAEHSGRLIQFGIVHG